MKNSPLLSEKHGKTWSGNFKTHFPWQPQFIIFHNICLIKLIFACNKKLKYLPLLFLF